MDDGKKVSLGSSGHGQGDRPEPRHGEEAYSTPPYGQPGPWAPAPPVQRPDPTPPAGTTLAAPADAPSADATPANATRTDGARPAATASVTGGSTPARGTPSATAPAPSTSAPAPPAATGAAPAAGTPAAAGGTPPGGTATPPAAPAAAPVTAALPGEPLRRYDPWATTVGAVPPTAAPPGTGATGPSRWRRGRLVVGAAAIALVAGLVGGAVGVRLERDGAFTEVTLPQAGAEERPPAEGSIAGIANEALPGVVTLHVTGAEEAGTGTGFVLDRAGHILTNAHVVAPAGDNGVIDVTFSSGDQARAEVVGADSGYDLAVVKVSGVSGLAPLKLGNSDNVRVGDPVVAIGAPFDLEGTVTSGIISATERPITTGGTELDGSDISYVNALQTDAPINPGNSGGPLVDVSGRVIGVNTAIRSADSGGLGGGGSAGSIGLGFAIPINQAKDVAEQLINVGYATHPVIGVMLDTDYLGEGARVATSVPGEPAVVPGGPADEAGIEDGDVITAVDGDPVRSGDELIVKIRSHQPGDRLKLTISRAGRELDVTVTLGEESGS